MLPTRHSLATPYPVGPVNCYSAVINDQLVLFDTGPPTAEARQYLQQHLDLEQLRHVLLTHCHIDHYGLAAWLEQEYGCTIYLPYRDALKISHHNERLDGMETILQKIGFSQSFTAAFRSAIDNDSIFPEFPQRFKIAEQDLPAELGIEILPCPGHSQSDLVYSAENWAITGDTMLDDIFQTPMLDIDLLTGKRFDNYRSYCQTIVKLVTLRDRHILPGHKESIVSVDHSICQYVGKLLERARRSRSYTKELNAPQVVEKLFGGTVEEPFLKYLKTSEIVFIQDFLNDPQPLKTALETAGLYPQLADQFDRAVR